MNVFKVRVRLRDVISRLCKQWRNDRLGGKLKIKEKTFTKK